MNRHAARFDEQYTRYQSDRGLFRRMVRHLYLRRTLRRIRGRTLDFGCGIGELLALLPAGSAGYEVNEASVQYGLQSGLDVRLYRPEEDGYRLADCQAGQFETFVMMHVLEHLHEAPAVLRALARSCRRIGISRMILVLPGRKGFLHDPTHATFINRAFLEEHDLANPEGYRIVETTYFPLPMEWGGKVFTHSEMMVVYDR